MALRDSTARSTESGPSATSPCGSLVVGENARESSRRCGDLPHFAGQAGRDEVI